jgi:hypothetical protein
MSFARLSPCIATLCVACASNGAGETAQATEPSAESSDGDPSRPAEPTTPSDGASSAASSSAETPGSAPAAAALPYANVVAVEAAGSPGAYTFSVSVESADVDCSQFANFWEVLSEDGALLYRRILEHSHTDENGTSDTGASGNTFTRTGGPVEVSASEVVVVRAHMSTGGYRGQVRRGSVDDGFASATDLEAGFALDVETQEPQPTGCAF